MANSTIKTRIQLKCDTEANWKKSVLESEGGEKVSGTSFIPLRGELIVYSADMAHPFSRLKIGDGITNVVMLPFIDANTLSGTSINDIQTTLTGYKTIQNIVTAPAEQDNRWVSGINQDENGRIIVSYKSLVADNNSLSNMYISKVNGEAFNLSINSLSVLDKSDSNFISINFKAESTNSYNGKLGQITLFKTQDIYSNLKAYFSLRQYTFSSTTKEASTQYYDDFSLPETSSDQLSTNFYKILTTKTTTSIGSENNPIFFNDQGQPQACGDETATSTKKLEAISAAGKIGFYSNGTSTLGITITTKDNITSFPIRMSSTTDSGVQLGIYKQVNLRQNFVIWPSTANSVIGDIVFYRSSGSSEITNGTKTWGQGNFGRITYEGPYSKNVNGENTAYTTSRFAFKQYSHSNSIANSYYDIFYLPSTSGNTENHAYNILTSKYAVTIGQGGTGATTVSNAKANLGLGLNSVPQFQGLILHNQNDSAEYTNLTLNYINDFTSNINLHEDGYLKIDITNLQNTSKYRGIKLDSEATINNALMFFDNSTNSIINYKIYHSGNIADLVNDLTPYFQSANGVSF